MDINQLNEKITSSIQISSKRICFGKRKIAKDRISEYSPAHKRKGNRQIQSEEQTSEKRNL